MSFIALVDCNNFFVSCERVFNPGLCGKPVVVLSNNDGCIVARSQEARKLGVPMGAPHYQWVDFFKRQGVIALSSNFSLYSDLSERVMQTLRQFSPDLEIYSVDEAFLIVDEKEAVAWCQKLRETIRQWTGIPVSIGIAPTKTLAKVASKQAKKTEEGVFGIFSEEVREALLQQLPAREIWGIGRRMSLSLEKKGIRTAGQFKDKEDLWIRRNFSVMGLKTAWELRGQSCFSFEQESVPKQSLLHSRTFGRPLLTKEELLQAVASFASSLGEKLREERSMAGCLQVFIMTSPHKEAESYYGNQALTLFPEPTSYTPALIEAAVEGVKRIFRPGYAYKRAGVHLSQFSPEGALQRDLFVSENGPLREKKRQAMVALDAINTRFGAGALHFAQSGKNAPFRKVENKSPCYTTEWDELLTIKL